jgi:hypothetical protein
MEDEESPKPWTELGAFVTSGRSAWIRNSGPERLMKRGVAQGLAACLVGPRDRSSISSNPAVAKTVPLFQRKLLEVATAKTHRILYFGARPSF